MIKLVSNIVFKLVNNIVKNKNKTESDMIHDLQRTLIITFF